jgi:hypothetical protein
MLATDFFTVETAWLQRLHVLFFIEIASRKAHLAGITANPTNEWVAQQARNLAWKLQDGVVQARNGMTAGTGSGQRWSRPCRGRAWW